MKPVLSILAALAVFAGDALAFYDPSGGKWLTRDPIGEAGGENLYAFARNDPVNNVDPLGADVRFVNDPGRFERFHGPQVQAFIANQTEGTDTMAAVVDALAKWNAVEGVVAENLNSILAVDLQIAALEAAYPSAYLTRQHVLLSSRREEFVAAIEAADAPEAVEWATLIPLYGSARLAGADAAIGNQWRAAQHLAMSALDAFLVRSLAHGAARLLAAPRPQIASTILSGVGPANGGQGLFGLVRPSGSIDASLQSLYLRIARSPEFARDLARYNRYAVRLGQQQAASVDEIVLALQSHTTFALTPNFRAGVFVAGQHPASTRFFLQGNPGTLYGARAGRHELTHLGAALRGQGDTILHELGVQAATTPEILWFMGGFLGGGIGVGVNAGLGR